MPQEPTIATRLDRLPMTRLHLFAVFVVGIGMFFDLYEVFLAGTVSTALTDDFHVSSQDLKPLLASSFVGAFLGAVVMSRVADRLGRRRAFYLTLAVYSVFSVLAAFSANVEMLIIFRFLAGLGIGGELPLCDAYLSDLLPARMRGRLIGWAYTVGFCGVPVAGFLALAIVPHTYLGVEGWRIMFVIGGLGAAICWLLRRPLPESPRWLAAMGRHAEADTVVGRFESSPSLRKLGASPGDQGPADHGLGDHGLGDHRPGGAERPGAAVPPARSASSPLGGGAPHSVPDPRTQQTGRPKAAPIRDLFHHPYRKRTTMLMVFQILQVFGYYGFGTLVPLVLAAKGYDVVHSLAFSAVSFVGYPIGSALSVFVIERMERKTLIILSALGMLGFGLAFGYCSGSAAIMILGFCYTATSNVFSNAYHVYQSELYPTTLRATGAGGAYSLSRLATAAMPFILLPVLDDVGAGAVFIVIAAAMAAIVLNVGLLGPRTTGISLTDGAEGPQAEIVRPGAIRTTKL